MKLAAVVVKMSNVCNILFQFAMVETVLTGCMDQMPHLRPMKTFVILFICIAFFLLGLPLTCSVSMYI